MLKRFCFGLCAVLLFPSFSFSQELESWGTFVSHLQTNFIDVDRDGTWWVATAGGLYARDTDGFITTYSKLDGMYDINASAMVYDPDEHVIWLGFGDGMLATLDIDSGMFRTINDIFRSDRFISKRINRLRVHNGHILAGTDFGLVIFDSESRAVAESYINFGTIGNVVRVNDLTVVGDTYYLATVNGIAIGDPSAGDLILGSNWGFFNDSNGFISASITKIEAFNGELFATSGESNFRYNGTQWAVESGWGGTILNYRLIPGAQVLLGVRLNSVMQRTAIGFSLIAEYFNGTRFSTATITGGQPVIGTANRGLAIPEGSGITLLQVDGPFLNFFEGITFSDGVLATSTSPAPGRFNAGFSESGYSFFENNRWTNFNNATESFFLQNGLNSFYTSTANETDFFFGSWGSGVVKHNKNSGEITVYNTTESGIVGVDGFPNFIVNIALSSDAQNRVWAVQWANNTKPLAMYDPAAGTWTSYDKIAGVPPPSQYRNVYADSYGQLWITLQTSSFVGRGLMVVRGQEDGTPESFILGTDENAGNLPNEKVNAVIQDLRGEVWAGTDRGMARFIFPDRIIDGSAQERRSVPLVNEDTTVTDRILLRDVRISALAVDAANQKWVGSDGDGVFLIDENGRRVIRQFTTTNSPLLSNSIKSIAIDNQTGTVYFATDRGLNSFVDITRAGERTMETLHVYPNPYSYSVNEGDAIIIERLGTETTVHITTVDGRLVNRLSVRGGRVSWNGLDYTGRKVPTGIYFIVATGQNNNQRATGKILIVR